MPSKGEICKELTYLNSGETYTSEEDSVIITGDNTIADVVRWVVNQEGCAGAKHLIDIENLGIKKEWEDKQNQVVLGNGDVRITDIASEDGSFCGVGFAFDIEPVEIGEYIPNTKKESQTDIDNGIAFRIISTKTESIDVVIEALQTAKERLKK